jgi:hypothetical protein
MEKEERILVPLGGSECAEAILPRVEELVAGKKKRAFAFCELFLLPYSQV